MFLMVIALLSPAFALLLILAIAIKNRKKKIDGSMKSFAFALGYIFGVFGYSMRFFSETNDLLSYFEEIKNYSSLGLIESMSYGSDGLFLKNLLFSFVEKSGDVHLLPFIVGFAIYSIVFYVLFDLVKRSKRDFSLGEVLLLGIIAVGILSPYSIIGNTRCVLSYVLVSFAVYRDTIQKKRNIVTILLYLLPLGLHTSTIIIILIRLLSILIQKFTKIRWFLLSVVFAVPFIIEFAYEHISMLPGGTVSNLISNAVYKAYSYLNWTSGGWATQVDYSISSKLTKIFGTIFIIGILYIIFRRMPKNENHITESSLFCQPMISYLFCVSVFALGCLSIKTGVFWRFESIVVLFSPVVLVQALSLNDCYMKVFHYLAVYASVLLLYNIAYQISNLDFPNTMMAFLSTSSYGALTSSLMGLANVTEYLWKRS